MAKFLDSLQLVEIDDTFFQIDDSPFRYESDYYLTIPRWVIVVPVGFKTDFASVPRIGLLFAILGDRAHEPAVIHDWLYYIGYGTRDIADSVLLEAMGVIGMASWRKYPIYWGVRIGGWVAWNAHRKAGHSNRDFTIGVDAVLKGV